ncbi:MAG: hypothetical protein AB2693_02555 [Candidatus Thiodiazotropha sp.]
MPIQPVIYALTADGGQFCFLGLSMDLKYFIIIFHGVRSGTPNQTKSITRLGLAQDIEPISASVSN